MHKGKIESPVAGLSPRTDTSLDTSECEDSIQPEQVMKLQLEVLEGEQTNI